MQFYMLACELQGGTLLHKVSKHMTSITKVYTNAQALQWALEIASALEYLHLRDPAVFHRYLCNSRCCFASRAETIAKPWNSWQY